MRSVTAIAASAAAFLAGCTSVMTDTALAPVFAQEMTFKPDTQRAKSGDVILQQTVLAAETARLDSSAIGKVVIDLTSHPEVEFRPGDLFYGVVLKDRRNQAAFCSTQIVDNLINSDGRACVVDEDNDGNFDRMWYFPEAGARVTFDASEITSLTDGKLKERAKYTRLTPKDLPPATFGIVYRCPVFDNCMFNVYELRESDKIDLGFVNFPISSSKNPRPVVVDVLGAKIEIILNSLSDIEYRVLKGFPTTKPIGILRHQRPDPIIIYY